MNLLINSTHTTEQLEEIAPEVLLFPSTQLNPIDAESLNPAPIPVCCTLEAQHAVETTASKSSEPSIRYPWIDVVKGMAAVVIMAHHITLYSPYSSLADEFAGAITIPLYNQGPLAVQIFMVFGGFALALSMTAKLSAPTLASTLLGRYLRLGVPYFAMLVTLLVCWRVFGADMNHQMIEEVSWGQIFAHLLFLQDLMGYDNLSAGTWYLCIDIQYMILCVSLLWISSLTVDRIGKSIHPVRLTAYLLAALGATSAWYWNLNPVQDCWTIYFLATLVLGTLLGWWIKGLVPTTLVLLYAASILVSQLMEFRLRIMVGLLTAAFLIINTRRESQSHAPKVLTWLGKISYSLFLIHYVVSSVVLHLVEGWVDDSPIRAVAAMVLAMATSVLAAWVLNVVVEQPTQRATKAWLSRKLKVVPCDSTRSAKANLESPVVST